MQKKKRAPRPSTLLKLGLDLLNPKIVPFLFMQGELMAWVAAHPNDEKVLAEVRSCLKKLDDLIEENKSR